MYGYSWFDKLTNSNSDWEIRYLYSIYFSFITICTVGYGDISPVSPVEIIYVMVVVVVGCGTFGYAINTIGQII
jgi:hypothetical protein